MSTPYLAADPERGATRPYQPGGISMINPVGISLRSPGSSVNASRQARSAPADHFVPRAGNFAAGWILLTLTLKSDPESPGEVEGETEDGVEDDVEEGFES